MINENENSSELHVPMNPVSGISLYPRVGELTDSHEIESGRVESHMDRDCVIH